MYTCGHSEVSTLKKNAFPHEVGEHVTKIPVLVSEETVIFEPVSHSRFGMVFQLRTG